MDIRLLTWLGILVAGWTGELAMYLYWGSQILKEKRGPEFVWYRITWSIMFLGALVELLLLNSPFVFGVYLLGLVLAVGGFLLNYWSIYTLGSGFTLYPRSGQKLITSGPYRFVRHPAYFGGLMIIFGLTLVLNSIYTLTLFPLPLVIVRNRVLREERGLVTRMKGYKEYAEKTSRLVPGVW